MIRVLGIESSCDESAAAIIGADRSILAHRLASQHDAHQPYGGVVPEIAARAHITTLPPMISAVLEDADMALQDCDAIAATAGPGLVGGVMVGLVMAKALAMACGKPLLAINHLEGHALSPRLDDPDLIFPYLLLLVSGGHCQILRVDGPGNYQRLATTIDDALGEAYDKTAKLLGLGYPGGPAVEKLAATGNAEAVPLPRPLLGSKEPHFSFAGLKSAVLRSVESREYKTEDIAASFQAAAIDCLIDRLGKAVQQASAEMDKRNAITRLVVAGGVASNLAIRTQLAQFAAHHGLAFSAPPLWLCTDNAAMIGWAAIELLQAGHCGDPLDIKARPRWPLDDTAPPVRGAGVKA